MAAITTVDSSVWVEERSSTYVKSPGKSPWFCSIERKRAAVVMCHYSGSLPAALLPTSHKTSPSSSSPSSSLSGLWTLVIWVPLKPETPTASWHHPRVSKEQLWVCVGGTSRHWWSKNRKRRGVSGAVVEAGSSGSGSATTWRDACDHLLNCVIKTRVL